MKQIRTKISIGFVGKKIIIASVSAVILLILLVQLLNNFITPRFNELFTSMDRWKVVEQIYNLKEKNLSELESNKQRLTEMASQENRQALIPGTAQAPEALIILRQKLAENGIDETGFYIDPPESYSVQDIQDEEGVTRQSVIVMGVGKYAAILDYIDAIHGAEYFYKPNSYELTSRGSLKSNSVRFTAKYTLFVLKERSDLSGAEIQYENRGNQRNPFYSNP